jgi:prepilin-type N-terminal cleavage/methylation domain-containing protein
MRARGLSLSRARPGFSLIETLVVMFALGMVMLFSTAILLGILRMADAATAAFDHQIWRSVLADDFRADVAQAADAPANAGEWTASRTCLILRRPDGRQVIYSWTNNELERLELRDAEVSHRRLPVGRGGLAVEFTRAGDDGRLLTLRLSETRGLGARKRQLEFAAALGGDLR